MFLHASRLSEYREPFGAQPCDGLTDLYIDTPSDAEDVTLCYTYGLYGFSYHEEPMRLLFNREEGKRYKVSLMLPHEPGLLFYWFRFRLPTTDPDFPHVFDEALCVDDDTVNATLYYVADGDVPDGRGKLYFEPPRVGADQDKYPYAWQITVFNKDFVTPDKMKGAMIYQIFPDRFARDHNFDFVKMTKASDREERVYHEDWYEDVDIYGKPSTGYLACDFYGGSLRGIAQKLEYIKSLGIDIIYLNPIFEARSSHRYDTADYMNVDPILGGNEAFDELCSKAREMGITLILDGVFSHTGADSRYFNKFDRYDGVGAFRSFNTGEESRYRSWYHFFMDGEGNTSYDSWWGFPDLPNVDENDLSYRNFIFGKDGVVETWTGRGAGGIRLDVSDELPDSFIRQMRDVLKRSTNGEGILVGEVWEDASNKCSYGNYRDFMLGNTHDSVMGYTFRSALLEFLNGHIDASVYNAKMEGLRERYPAQAYYSIMNLISSHDVPRAFTLFAKPEDREGREEQLKIKVPEELQDECADLMRMAYAIQVGYIGACCLYYGDEILMDGYKDPFNRRTYPWGKLTGRQQDELDTIRKIASLRVENPVLRTGFYKTLLSEGDTLAFERTLVNDRDFFGKVVEKGSRRIVLILNRSEKIRYYHVSGGAVAEKETSPVPVFEGYVKRAESFVSGFDVAIKPLGFLFIIY